MGVGVERLADEIGRMLSEYGEEITKNIDASGKAVAKEGVKQLKKVSPKNQGDYAKGWTTNEEGGTSYGDGKKFIIHNKKHYRLAHLLEHGHVTRNGQRTRPSIHIAPVEEAVQKEYERMVEEAIRHASR